MIKAVLFDLDGTLVNSIYDIGGAMNVALESLGQPTFPIEQYYKMVGNGMKKLCQRALAEDQQHLLEELLQRYQTQYLAHCCDDTVVYEGVPQLLNELHEQGYKLAVITNKPADQAKRVMDTLLPGAPLDVVWGQQKPFAVKPDPAVYHHVCNLLGVQAGETLYCGDSDVDMLFAKNAGAKGAGCLWGFRDEAELKAAGADYLAKAPLGILECL
ncbi:MAG: HAD family hydrolase [Clostridia bacterium]|nr:HAD family hydrolase [Clostridia bacterium]